MKIEIYKKDNNDVVYYTINGSDEQRLTFDNIKEISKNFLEKKLNDKSIEYEILTKTSDLELYKTTLKEVIDSILSDDELLNLYKEKVNNDDNNEEKTE